MAQPKTHDELEVLTAYRAHRAAFQGGDRDFLAAQAFAPPVSETWLRKHLAKWRDRARLGLDPITGQASDAARALLDELGEPNTTLQAQGSAQAERLAQAHAARKAQGTQSGKAELQALTPEARRIRRAEKVLDRVLRGEVVKPSQHKAAEQVLTAAGKLGKPRTDPNRAKVSEFTTWPSAALAQLVQELAPAALKTRHDPAPPSVVTPADERDAARLDEASAQPTSSTA